MPCVSSIAERVGVDLADVGELDELEQEVHPEALLDTIETVERQTDVQPKSTQHTTAPHAPGNTANEQQPTV